MKEKKRKRRRELSNGEWGSHKRDLSLLYVNLPTYQYRKIVLNVNV